ncbi:MAG: DinB family protein [Spirochaetes bacterium]|nr:DinB family protein [Spirochaetota bacterium]
MTVEERLKLVSEFENAYDAIRSAVAKASPKIRKYIPPIEGAWSIDEHLVHLLDADANMVFRLRGATAEPGVAVPVWKEEAWRSRLRYDLMDGPRCLEIAVSLRSFLAAGLRAIAEEDWSAYHIQHPVRGKMDIVAVLTLYRDHAGFHKAYIDRNLDAAGSV